MALMASLISEAYVRRQETGEAGAKEKAQAGVDASQFWFRFVLFCFHFLLEDFASVHNTLSDEQF